MATNMQKAQDLLFGKDGLGASNFKMFPGSNRDATTEEVAEVLAASLEKLANGKLIEVHLDD